MSSKKTSSNKATIGMVKFEAMPRVKRPGRHAKRIKPPNQTFFPRQKAR